MCSTTFLPQCLWSWLVDFISQKCRMAMAPLIACMRLEGMLGGPGYEQIKPLRKILFPKEDK
jgi:hypothetical protein